MKIQDNNYIPVRHIPNRPFSSEEKGITKEIIDKTKELIKEELEAQEIRKKIISNNEKMLSINNKMQSNSKKMLSIIEKAQTLKPIFEAGLARINAQQETNEVTVVTTTAQEASTAYKKAGEFLSATKQTDTDQSINPIEQREILTQADFSLNVGNYRQALNDYGRILSNRDNKPVGRDYVPMEEKLRQASRLYVSFQPLIDNLNVNEATKLKLYCTGIAAHTLGTFSSSKAEILHMIQNRFYYS